MVKINDESLSPDVKIAKLNECGANRIHPSVSFKNGTLVATLQVGHPNEEGSISGCYSTHIIEAITCIQKHYQSMLPCEENEECIGHLEAALESLNKRASRRRKQGIQHTDKENK